MSNVRIIPGNSLGFNYIPGRKDEERPLPFGTTLEDWRSLSSDETAILKSQGNQADSWDNILVQHGFQAELVRHCHFYGPNRIGALQDACLEHHDFKLPIGLYSSTIIACDISHNAAIHNVAYLSHTRIGERCILFNIDEVITTNHAKFGNGVIKEGESEEIRIWVEIANENAGRKVLPFDGILPADAWIWSKYRDDEKLMKSFVGMTDKLEDSRLGHYSLIDDGSVIKDSRILKDIRIGKSAYIKGANKLKNLTINSSPDQPTQIGEGCELVNGIIGYACRVFYGVKAVRFVLSDHSVLKYGARLINSILGPNSTISCCEVLNSLLFGAHEQHHNSSFLCASIFKGMSNMAAAATIGSNHNSRANDGEITADRGFWPGLSVSLKHNSRFAAFCLITRGSYPSELNITLPFCLVSNNEAAGELNLMPGYWFHYNMYALARNSSKTAIRDSRSGDCQQLEYDWLAPDTVDQMLVGRKYLESWADQSQAVTKGDYPDGKSLLQTEDPELIIGTDTVESGKRPVRILHAGRGWRDYGLMIRFYIVRTLLDSGGYEALAKALASSSNSQDEEAHGFDSWENIGGQLMRNSDLERLKENIRSGKIDSWDGVHRAYKKIAGHYRKRRCEHAKRILMEFSDSVDLETLISEALNTARFIFNGIKSSRLKDYENSFRNSIYDSEEERDAVIGKFCDNTFISESGKELEALQELFRC